MAAAVAVHEIGLLIGPQIRSVDFLHLMAQQFEFTRGNGIGIAQILPLADFVFPCLPMAPVLRQLRFRSRKGIEHG